MPLPGEKRDADEHDEERCRCNALGHPHAARYRLQRRNLLRLADGCTALHRRIAVVLKRRACVQGHDVVGCGASTDMCKPQLARRPQQDGYQRDRGKRHEDAATNRQ